MPLTHSCVKSQSRPDAFFLQIGSLQQLVRLFDLMPDVSFFMKDREARFVALNRLGCEFCNVKSEREALGKSERDFFPAERAEEYLADDREVMESGLPKLNRIEPAPERGGSPHLVITNKIPMRDANGRVIGPAGFSRRIEHLRTAPATMRKLACGGTGFASQPPPTRWRLQLLRKKLGQGRRARKTARGWAAAASVFRI